MKQIYTEKENLQPSSSKLIKRYPGLKLGIIQLLEKVDSKKQRWKVKCLKCGHIFEIGNSTITSYAQHKTNHCQCCPKEKNSIYKIGDIYAGIKIINYTINSKFLVECLNCKRQFELDSSSLLKYVRWTENSQEYKYCSYCKPRTVKSRKYHKGEIIGNCYELIKFLGGNSWLVKCTKCGKEQEQLIPNLKKHKSNNCFYCNHPYSTKTAFNRTRLSHSPIDERIYTYYKNKVERNNTINPTTKQKPFNLSLEEYTKLIHSNCYYCGAEPTSDNVWNKSGKRKCDEEMVYVNGIDRIDSDKGYTIDNCVPCCPICNRMKLDYTTENFYKQIEKIYLKRLNDQSKDVATNVCEMGGILIKDEEMV